jgi:predicted phosphodiesterase
MTTKIAVIADIHGNSSALQAVLENIEKDADIEHIYCLGDMIGIGHETNEVLELLYSRNDVSFIIGNHEEEFINILEGKRAENHGGERQHHEWLVSRMDKKFKSILFELPPFKEVELEGKNILFIHYHLDANQIFLPIDNEPSAEKLDKIYKNSSADVVCFGHHHPVHFFKT